MLLKFSSSPTTKEKCMSSKPFLLKQKKTLSIVFSTCAEAANACCSCCCSCFWRRWTWWSAEQGASAADRPDTEAPRMGELSRREGSSDSYSRDDTKFGTTTFNIIKKSESVMVSLNVQLKAVILPLTSSWKMLFWTMSVWKDFQENPQQHRRLIDTGSHKCGLLGMNRRRPW